MTCKNCGKDIHLGDGGTYVHDNGSNYCNFDMAEPIRQLTPAEKDLDLIGKRLPALEEEQEWTGRAAAALYRTVLRLAEKVGLE